MSNPLPSKQYMTKKTASILLQVKGVSSRLPINIYHGDMAGTMVGYTEIQ